MPLEEVIHSEATMPPYGIAQDHTYPQFVILLPPRTRLRCQGRTQAEDLQHFEVAVARKDPAGGDGAFLPFEVAGTYAETADAPRWNTDDSRFETVFGPHDAPVRYRFRPHCRALRQHEPAIAGQLDMDMDDFDTSHEFRSLVLTFWEEPG
ncbi:MAG: hypothetical protein AAGF74_10195 [Pseudomonadota bacterium]